MFSLDDPAANPDLSWQLRTVGGIGVRGKLESYIRTTAPRTTIKELILRDHDRVAWMCSKLGITWSTDDTDEYLLNSIIWKLGFDALVDDNLSIDFWRKHDDMTHLAQAASLNTVVDEDKISAGAGVYFRRLEGLLEDALVYCTWALCTDHIIEADPFVYVYDDARQSAMQTLTRMSEAINSKDPIIYGDNNTLYPLIRGFDILAEHLNSLLGESKSALHLREAMPEYHGKTSIKEFPLLHTIPFLDLLGSSQAKIIDDLKSLSRDLSSSRIHESRNALLHFRRSSADVNALTMALETVRTAIRRAEQSGIVRTLYVRDYIQTDEWARSTVSLRSREGQSVTFFRPTPFDWLGMPDMGSPQFLFHSALFAEPNEMLRFSNGRPSEYSRKWSSYPRRPTSSGASVANHSKSKLDASEA